MLVTINSNYNKSAANINNDTVNAFSGIFSIVSVSS